MNKLIATFIVVLFLFLESVACGQGPFANSTLELRGRSYRGFDAPMNFSHRMEMTPEMQAEFKAHRENWAKEQEQMDGGPRFQYGQRGSFGFHGFKGDRGHGQRGQCPYMGQGHGFRGHGFMDRGPGHRMMQMSRGKGFKGFQAPPRGFSSNKREYGPLKEEQGPRGP